MDEIGADKPRPARYQIHGQPLPATGRPSCGQ